MIKITEKPKSLEAIQWTKDNLEDVLKFLNLKVKFPMEEYKKLVEEHGLQIPNPERKLFAELNDWIVKGDEFIPCKPEMFEKIYQPL